MVATGLLPLLEQPFGRTTAFTLLELSNLNEPMLKHLILTAPGTYHHSTMVGTLAEAAAEAVGANALLCRVGAYYHDIGKTRHPTYFIENSTDASDRHEKLAPSLSRAIVMSHVKEGIEMARGYGLPDVLVDMIPQHHGTRLVSFFYQRAKDAADPGLQAVKRGRLSLSGAETSDPGGRHPDAGGRGSGRHAHARGPDAGPHPGAVQKIINAIFVDGQLDECDLTLRDLHIIANSFVRILTGFFHHRIEYPDGGPEEGAKKRSENGDQSQKSATEGSRRNGPAKKGGAKDPARAGAPDGGL